MKRIPRYTYRTALRTKGVKTIPPYAALRSSKAGEQVIDALAGRLRPIPPMPVEREPMPLWAILLVTFIVAWFGAALLSGAGQ
jgi:hypothetical protein